jgi:membrane protease YdiL (CAAX protease family)
MTDLQSKNVSSSIGSPSHYLIIFVVLSALFYLNDFVFIALRAQESIYFADYAFRICVLMGWYFWLSAKSIGMEQQEGDWGWKAGLVCALVLPILGRVSYYTIEVPFVDMTGINGLFDFPSIENPVFYWFDLSFGLLLVALSEELVFRKIALKWLESCGYGFVKIVVLSATLFSLMHWGSGPGRLIYAFVSGVLYMAVYLKVRRLWPVVLAHWIQNFAAFGPYDL